jgi:hypothetical protein
MNDRWSAMLDEFRALGGTATNLCLKVGPYGRGLFPEDPSRPVHIAVPENLQFFTDELVFHNGELRAAPNSTAGDRERAWFEGYSNEFSWGGEGRTGIERFLHDLQALPEGLRQILASRFGLGLGVAPITDEVVQQRFLRSRAVGRGQRSSMMPVLELANHGLKGAFETDSTITLKGHFEGEILFNYGGLDPWGLFQGWGIAAECDTALSLPLSVPASCGELVVGRQTVRDKTNGPVTMPELQVSGGRASLTYLLLGLKSSPSIPKGVFYHLFKDPEAETTFDTIRNWNQLQFLGLLEALEDLHTPIVLSLRKAARFQLQALCYCCGAREI